MDDTGDSKDYQLWHNLLVTFGCSNIGNLAGYMIFAIGHQRILYALCRV